MNDTVNQLVASHKASMETLTALTTQAFAGIEKLVDLNMAASRAALTQSFSHLSGAVGMKDPKDLLSLQSVLLKPLADKTAAYAQHLQALVTQSGVEFAKAVEARTALAQEGIGGLLDTLARTVPAGGESGIAAFKNAVAAGQDVFASAQANFTAAACQAADAVAKTTRVVR